MDALSDLLLAKLLLVEKLHLAHYGILSLQTHKQFSLLDTLLDQQRDTAKSRSYVSFSWACCSATLFLRLFPTRTSLARVPSRMLSRWIDLTMSSFASCFLRESAAIFSRTLRCDNATDCVRWCAPWKTCLFANVTANCTLHLITMHITTPSKTQKTHDSKKGGKLATLTEGIVTKSFLV